MGIRMTQAEMFGDQTTYEQEALRSHLRLYGWQTRRQICDALAWSERKVREVAESLGVEVVRGQAGFKLTSAVTREDWPAVEQAIEAFHSQARKNEAYALALRRRLHEMVG